VLANLRFAYQKSSIFEQDGKDEREGFSLGAFENVPFSKRRIKDSSVSLSP
jgi:hypothetical protein